MFDNHAAAQFHRVGKVDSVMIAYFPVEPAVNDAERSAQDVVANAHAPVAEAVNRHRAKTGLSPIPSMAVFADLLSQVHEAVSLLCSPGPRIAQRLF